jgi:uncharacterized repeat protein (TIGR01451 family)
MKCHQRFAFGHLALLAFAMSGALAQESVERVTTSAGLDVETIAERRVVTASADGPQVEFALAQQLRIGDEICYTLRVRNDTLEPIAAPVIVKSIPRNTEYIFDSAVGPAALVSVSADGGSTFVAAADAASAELTHLRWQLKHPLAPGATALLRFRGVFR